MKAINPNRDAATGSVAQAAVFLSVSVIAMLGAVSLQFFGWSVAALFVVWLSATTFTLGILEYRRSQMPAYEAGPEV